ncbi:MAG TPA: phosphate transport system regulatory protein PhoU [Deltaproteobacteria bacterium]|nr:MAG: phosphate transport system regulatory protein PhoU [Deltaproteobacteria bacterium GWA2_45_12]HBF11894.1 phosphate transport system regulatory protein PhoU [Deltaproteobacteria bacterium]
MTIHLEKDLEHLKKEILAMGAVVEQMLNKAISSFVRRRADQAEEVLGEDDVIDRKENEIEEECLRMLALQQPVASDLRFIITVMKVNNDLERMADVAASIASRAKYLATHDPIKLPVDFTKMVEKVQGMVHQSLDALVNMDVVTARKILQQDDDVDQMNRSMYASLEELMIKDSQIIKRAMNALSVSRNLERIADLATNIAEDIIFMVEGHIVRHRYE